MKFTSAPLWDRRQTTAMALAAGAGALLLVLAYAGSEDSKTLTDQVLWLNLAVLGIIVAGAAELLWLLAARRRVSLARDVVIERYGGHVADASSMSHPRPTDRSDTDGATGVVVDGSTWLHRRACPLAAGKPVRPSASDEVLGRCPVCGDG